MEKVSAIIKMLQTKVTAFGIWPAVLGGIVVLAAVTYDYLTFDFGQWDAAPQVAEKLGKTVPEKPTYEKAVAGDYNAVTNRLTIFEKDDNVGHQVFGYSKIYMFNPDEQKRHTTHTTAKQGMKMSEISYISMSEDDQIEFRNLCLKHSNKKELCPKIIP